MDKEEKLEKTEITIGIIEEKLLKLTDNRNIHLISFKSQTIAADKGALSIMIKLELRWSETDNKLPESVVIKCTTTGNLLTKIAENPETGESAKKMLDGIGSILLEMHKAECDFYNLINESGLKIQVPKCYYCQEMGASTPGFLIFEDLSQVHVQSSFGRGVTLKQAMDIAENLAQLHSWCLQNDGWKEKFQKTLLKRAQISKSLPESLPESYAKIREVLCPSHVNPEILNAVEKYAMQLPNVWCDTDLHMRLNMPEVLVHGDLWTGNIFMQKQNGNEDFSGGLLAIFDWQCVFPGCAAIDFARLAACSMSPKMRRNEMPKILQHYHNCLKKDLEPPYSLEKLTQAYHEGLKVSFLIGIPILWIIAGGMISLAGGEEFRQDLFDRVNALFEDMKFCFM